MIGIGLSKDELKGIAQRRREPPAAIFGLAQTDEEWNKKVHLLADWAIEMTAALIQENNNKIDRDFDRRVGRITF